MECSEEEYQHLQSQAASLTLEEAQSELLECARYGEVDAIRALLEHFHHNKPPTPSETNAEKAEKTRFVDCTDDFGSTALHKACANGHVSCVRVLIEEGQARFMANDAGNTPLHWAAAGAREVPQERREEGVSGEACVKLLLEGYPPADVHGNKNRKKGGPAATTATTLDRGCIDVLQKNEFGRSALTEAFTSQNTKVVGMLLEHETSTEDRLISGTNQQEVPSEEEEKVGVLSEDEKQEVEKVKGKAGGGPYGTNKTGKDGIIHEFDFLRTEDDANVEQEGEEAKADSKMEQTTRKSLLVRELPMGAPLSKPTTQNNPSDTDNPDNDDAALFFGKTPADDTTGLGIWCASLILARWMASSCSSSSSHLAQLLENKTVLELGAGCGVPGLSTALYSKAKKVFLTDVNPKTVENIKFNIALNAAKKKTGGSWTEKVEAWTIDWNDSSTYPTSSEINDGNEVDVVIGSDLIYQAEVVPVLRRVLFALLGKKKNRGGGVFLYVCPKDGPRDGLREFMSHVVVDKQEEKESDAAKIMSHTKTNEEGEEEDMEMYLHSKRLAPPLFHVNPLVSGDEEDAFLHFSELASMEYMLYEFHIRPKTKKCPLKESG